MENGKNNGAGDGVQSTKVPTLIVTMDPHTMQVAFNAGDLTIAVAQMMLEEVRRQLDITRRQAAQLELLRQVNEAKRVQAILDAGKGRG